MLCDLKHTFEPKADLEILPPHHFGELLFFCLIDSCLPLFMSILRTAMVSAHGPELLSSLSRIRPPKARLPLLGCGCNPTP